MVQDIHRVTIITNFIFINKLSFNYSEYYNKLSFSLIVLMVMMMMMIMMMMMMIMMMMMMMMIYLLCRRKGDIETFLMCPCG